MSYTQQFEQDSAMGCVCDFDVPCKSHPLPTTPHDACEYAGACSEECSWFNADEPDFWSDELKARKSIHQCSAAADIEEVIRQALEDADAEFKFYGGPSAIEFIEGHPHEIRRIGFKRGGHVFTVSIVRES